MRTIVNLCITFQMPYVKKKKKETTSAYMSNSFSLCVKFFCLGFFVVVVVVVVVTFGFVSAVNAGYFVLRETLKFELFVGPALYAQKRV